MAAKLREAGWLLTTPEEVMQQMIGLVPEEPVRYNDGHLYTVSRSPDHEGLPRWQVFRDNEFTPVGYAQGHRCPLMDGAPALVVFDTNNRPLRETKPGKDDGCVSNWHNVLFTLYAATQRG